MPEMWESRDGRSERPAASESNQEADWLERLAIISEEGDLLAWAGPGRWRHQETDTLNIVTVPKLWLTQKAVFRLVHARSLPSVFGEATMSAPGLLFPLCTPVSGRYYADPEPALIDAGFVLEGSNPRSLKEIVRAVASLLT